MNYLKFTYPLKRALAIALLVGVAPLSSQAATLTYQDLVKRLTDMEYLSVLPPAGEKGAMASSYNRKSQYDAATDKYIEWSMNGDAEGIIRKEGENSVLLDIQGPGCITRMWTATPGGRNVQIYLDGAEQPTVDFPWGIYFGQKVAWVKDTEPFTRPNLSYKTAARGGDNFVPIPFQKSCKIVAVGSFGGTHYQLNTITFPAGTVVPTFKLPLSAEDSAALDEANRIMGECGKDPAGKRIGQKTGTKNLTVPAGGKAAVGTLKGPLAITGLKVKLADLPKDIKEQRNLLAQLTVSITWDDESTPAVWAPLGDFFASAAGVYPFQTLPVGLMEDGTFYCYWYMPFGSKAQIEVGNDSAKPVAMTWEVACAPLTQPIAKLGRFHAKWHRDAFLPEREDRGVDWTILTTQGKGRFVGTQLHVWNPTDGWWGEGDEKFFVDGEKFPSTYGTGSEDYFGYAWGDPARFVHAFHSQPINENNQGHVSVNRWHIIDNLPFQTSFEGAIEKYEPNSRPCLYSAVAFWYLNAGGKDPYLPAPVTERTGWWPEYREVGGNEAEAMPMVNTPENQEKPLHNTVAQDMRTYGENIWSLNKQLFWPAEQVGESVSVKLLDCSFCKEFKPGKRRVVARFTKGPDYGICQLSIDKQKSGAPIDLYAPQITAAAPVDLGEVEIATQSPIVTLEVTGKNKASKGFAVGLDYIKLTPVE